MSAEPTMSATPDSLPALVRSLRERAGLTREQLAEMLGVGPRTVPTWETSQAYGRAIPTDKLVELLRAAGEGENAAAWADAMRLHAQAQGSPESPSP